MKIHIKEYPRWIGPYQIAEWLKYVGVSEKKYRSIGDKLNKTKLKDFCEWFLDKRQPKHKLQIDYGDVFDNHGLSLIILAWLKEYKNHLVGAPYVSDEDVPDHLKSGKSEEFDPSSDIDELWFKRWEWVIDEMIYGFDWHANSLDYTFEYRTEEGRVLKKAASERAANGLRLFAKYYGGLWI